MEDLLAPQALKDESIQESSGERKARESNSGTNGSDELDPKDWDTINVYMKILYAFHFLNAKYNRRNPVYL
ncbi:hypothetical protein VP01_940g3 [Puccinia sorghi]|uniref:Uncharacterized protein n=1 Tax=Puccinia sorghi TaxID=27349 RepID=A0A0L6U6Q8_9BASI|nr:hypothetical protein VP01_940g3 [Puccinia sorghi]